MVALEDSKLLRGLSPQEVQPFLRIAVRKAFAPAQPIFREGDVGDGLYVVAEGTIAISALVGRDKTQILSRLGPGDFFGEMAVLDQQARSATATAETAAVLHFIPRDAMLEALERTPRLAFSLVREFSLRLREFDRQYVQELLQAERLSLVGRFARSIVHDFKNPLAIISLAAEMGASPNAPLQSRQLTQERIRKQVDRLSAMINELLEFTRGSQTVNVLAPADFAQFMQTLLDEVQPEAAQKSVTLVCENPPPAIRILLDPRRLSHAFFNLFNNAADAMPEGGRITLRFTVEHQKLVIEVEDSGPGISPEIIGRLFQPFATYGKTHGTGLGLSIVQRIIQDHGGEISARNEPGHGAIFTIKLPLSEPAA